jgi:uncharacterized protein YcbK (DUF882 family)
MSVHYAFQRGSRLAPFFAAAALAVQIASASAAEPDHHRPPQTKTATVIIKTSGAYRPKIFSLARVMRGEVPGRKRVYGKTGLNGRLVGLLGRIERNYGRPVTITSGCRSRSANRQAGGARDSYHMRCMAADIRVAGVSEGQLLRFASRLPGVGGVGTYCGNSIVHIDVGPRRAWTGGCGHRKRRR